ncbi:MAG TPA: hypothetical protein PKJ65_00435 [Clostridia bacterium]|jgi:hypothetical protein|nr:MAG: hypothetical protein BWX78_00119 [Firmicutes bacterium ADurb.Bin099]HNZ40334.1 hypothetical protein [Clostridia bacterium]HPY97961.1 hypothetical protein [Clostridia bacterium]HQC69062.1 hypothetical protein [Clostridia bacterium]
MTEDRRNISAEEKAKAIRKAKIEKIVTISILVLLVLGIVSALIFKSIVGTWWVEIQTDSTTRGAYIYFGGDKTYETFMYGVDEWAEKGTYELKGTSVNGYIIFNPENGRQYIRQYNIRGTRLKIFNPDDSFVSFLRNRTD